MESCNKFRPGMYKVQLDPAEGFVLAEVKPGVHPLLNVRPKEGRFQGKWLTLALASITIVAAA